MCIRDSLFSAQIDWQMDEGTLQNVAAFYTEDKRADWETYDAAGAQQLRDVLETGDGSAILYGLDGIPLDAITQEQYVLAGSFDSAEFARGNYVPVSYTHLDVDKRQGVGLGLYLANGIITRQKGYISVKSKAGEGTTFSVYLLS